MQPIYLKQAKSITLIIAFVSLLQALLAIIGVMTVALTIPDQEKLNLTDTIIRRALLNTSINAIFFVIFTILFFVAFKRLKNGLQVGALIYVSYIIFMVVSILFGIIGSGFNLGSLLISLMLILLTGIALYSVKKASR
ncbi:hypothetical protein [Listeria fleischmannii]|uniref:hypothetical protein n=1 Tax=Listeria fleischmannii TaxID=1069827 RepID=UPI000254F04B|nr:hypothetical protein [Listeria fleischmannii]EIA21138.1 hypothetical protein KKC_03079 [Listeria fleischmannii subsp. coloradonensis]STY35143.1 Uncharacterised protein [Listeria fleischmannii subsp. coloradonensis]